MRVVSLVPADAADIRDGVGRGLRRASRRCGSARGWLTSRRWPHVRRSASCSPCSPCVAVRLRRARPAEATERRPPGRRPGARRGGRELSAVAARSGRRMDTGARSAPRSPPLRIVGASALGRGRQPASLAPATARRRKAGCAVRARLPGVPASRSRARRRPRTSTRGLDAATPSARLDGSRSDLEALRDALAAVHWSCDTPRPTRRSTRR